LRTAPTAYRQAYQPHAGAPLPAGPRPIRLRSPSMSGRIFLLRHGETEWSANGRHTGHTDIPLTEAGRDLAVAAGTLLAAVRGSSSTATVACSPMHRALDTASLAGLAPVVDERLHEWDYGQYEGLTTPQIRATVPGWTVWTHPVLAVRTRSRWGHGRTRSSEATGPCWAPVRGAGRARPLQPGVDRAVAGSARERRRRVPAGRGRSHGPGHERGVPRLDHVNLVTP